MNRLVFKSSRMPWMMHISPSMVATGLEARIIPMSRRVSSMNLNKKYTISAGMRKIMR